MYAVLVFKKTTDRIKATAKCRVAIFVSAVFFVFRVLFVSKRTLDASRFRFFRIFACSPLFSRPVQKNRFVHAGLARALRRSGDKFPLAPHPPATRPVRYWLFVRKYERIDPASFESIFKYSSCTLPCTQCFEYSRHL